MSLSICGCGQHRTTFGQEEEYDYVEGFTTEEYIEFQKRINEYPVLKEYIENLKEQIEFLRFNIAQQNDTIKNLSDGMKQRNFIEAKEWINKIHIVNGIYRNTFFSL